MKNRVFFPQALLDLLMDAKRIDIEGDELLLSESGSRYRVVEAVRVLRELTDGNDPNDLCGRVKSRLYLQEIGAELLGDSMIVADKAYEILTGFVGLPLGRAPNAPARADGSPPATMGPHEEEILAGLAASVG
jgi:hypothetical protein